MKVLRSCLATVCCLGLTAAALSQDQGKDAQTVDAKAERTRRARFVDFATELSMPIASLDDLGQQIDDARLAADPVKLVTLGKLLEAAETAAGKKASLTAAELSGEAVELAKQRGNAAELMIMAKILGGTQAQDLEAIAEVARDKQTEPQETARDLSGDLIVDNHSHSFLHVYVDGYEVGHVAPHSVLRFHVHYAHFALARDHFGRQWVASFDPGHYHHYVMVIHDPHHDH